MNISMKFIYLVLLICLGACKSNVQSLTEKEKLTKTRKEISLNQGWKTVLIDSLSKSEEEFVKNPESVQEWQNVDVPHNWDRYEGFRQMEHGNLHGTAFYQKDLKVSSEDKERQHFLFFEGVGSYATVWVNGQKVGEHKGGRTTFTLNITDALDFENGNTILVKADHPAFIADLPWVCGGCSGEWGFSEGSQPLGIFRPVSLLVTNEVRVEPFGIHIWNQEDISSEKALLFINSEVKNYSEVARKITILNELVDIEGNVVVSAKEETTIAPGTMKKVEQKFPEIENPKLWSPEDPYLYELSTSIFENGEVVDYLQTPYGIRWVSWPINREGEDNRLFINGEAHFINGTCEYEHLTGRSHAFTNTQVKARIEQMKAAGFNSFREGHQPHNLRYQKYLDELGITFWSQFSAHIWYDTPEFKENFKNLLRQWIKERRNSPSIIMWGLQNESTIPREFAEECVQIIREMDPNSSSMQRPVTTCNGGVGTDWNVIQNWSGTYGGDPFNYAEELTEQLLNGEYGAWRTTDLHTEGPFDQNGVYSENRFSDLMEIKVREAESVRDKVVGQYNWLFTSHENPGRIQNGEGLRDIDKLGPVNYKGLFTVWGEPTDAYYMYRANYVSGKKEPMVYLVSHTWPNRWKKPGIKDSLEIYSNCDEVELFNDVREISFGKKKNPGRGEHFQWNDVDVQYNVLYAVGYVDGEPVAEDYIILNNLPPSPNFDSLTQENNEPLKAGAGLNYLYRVNSGGPDYTDSFGQKWSADVQKKEEDTWGSLSWTDDFENLPAFFASQRRVFDPIEGTKDWELFQSFRYGMDKLRYEFPVPDGEYQVELYFIEPWYGTGGGLECTGWRNFDVAINESTVLKDLDIWKEVGHDKVLKKTFSVKSKNGQININFPYPTSGQAIISGIAIASKDYKVKPAPPSARNIANLKLEGGKAEIASWMDIGQKQYLDSEVVFHELPYQIYAADWIRFFEDLQQVGTFTSTQAAEVYVLMDSTQNSLPKWISDYEALEENAVNSRGDGFKIFKKSVEKGQQVHFGEKGTNSATMFSIAVVPQYEMGESENAARPTYEFGAEEAKVTGTGIESGNFKKSDYIEFTANTKNSIEFEVNPGLAGIYLMRYRYMNMNEDPIPVNLQIEDANGILLRDDNIEFPPAREKWKILNTTSGGYINAGTYKIKLTSEDMKGLRLESFEFQ